MRQADVCLALMPEAHLTSPSLSLSILKSALAQRGIGADVLYGTLQFLDLNLEALCLFLEMSGIQSGIFEHIFSRLTGADPARDVESYYAWLEHAIREAAPDYPIENLRRTLTVAKLKAAQLIEAVSGQVAQGGFRILGVSTTFQQTNASLALLKRAKEKNPALIAVMGGFNCFGEKARAILETYPYVDFVVSGEGEETFPALCEALLKTGGPPSPLPEGVLGRAEAAHPTGPVPVARVADLDRVPTPDCSDYFAQLKTSLYRKAIVPAIMYECSRGCAWASHKPCTFCALNLKDAFQRAKSPGRVLSEMKEISSSTGVQSFFMTDCLFPKTYLKTLIPALASSGAAYDILFDVRCDLTGEQLRAMREAGVSALLPGIESFNDHTLKLMNKGIRAIQNIHLLKQAQNLEILLLYNYLSGSPRERPEDVRGDIALMALLAHLQPPTNNIPLWFARDSAYDLNQEAYGLKLVPAPMYAYAFPDQNDFIARYANYLVDERAGESVAFSALQKDLTAAILAWRALYEQDDPPVLEMEQADGALQILDTRPAAVKREHLLLGADAALYRLCEAPAREGALRFAMAERPGGEVKNRLLRMTRDKLLLCIGDEYIALATQKGKRLRVSPAHVPGGLLRRPG